AQDCRGEFPGHGARRVGHVNLPFASEGFAVSKLPLG
ncbi:MAG: hypothetical protein ACI93T_003269, partial [Porticoccaceae bacterium]